MIDPITVAVGAAFGLSLVGVMVAGIAVLKAIDALIEVRAMKSSTHSIQYVTPEEAEAGNTKALNKELRKLDDEAILDIEDQQTDLDDLAEGTL